MRYRELILLMDGVIRFVDVGDQVGVVPRMMHIGQVCFLFEMVVNETPRRIQYDMKMQRMLVGCSNIERYVSSYSVLISVTWES